MDINNYSSYIWKNNLWAYHSTKERDLAVTIDNAMKTAQHSDQI